MPRLEDVLALVEKHLQTNEWFAGEARSAADMQMSFPLLAMRSVSAMDQYPSIERWLQTIRKDSDYQRAVERVGEFKAF
ncbi:MAG: glutathione binding-like protein [Pseudomonadota bacterium]|nr:glutathione binding-like protein [Pseudomonadota bacterium]